MKLDVYNIQGKKLGQTAELPAKIFEAPINTDLMHQAYVRQAANARLGTHKTKTRSEVAGGGRKPWKQKGTGRARQGSIRSAQWVGGGKIHTPRPRDYSQSMPQKMRQAALRSALSAKAAEQEIILVDVFGLDEAKTKLVAQAVSSLVGEGTALLVMPAKDDNYAMVQRAGRNLPVFKTLLANYVNVRDLLTYDKLILPLASIEAIENFLG
ncbi:MAG: 50S ribosomal protein L4 [Anaerolineales bacterium]|nr:50S ribosomal protein L4 [Anaerolineales bacterium]MCW5856439.1 50S ribosomal protein L4 [Anaerolineales bacterium]MCW5879277.1 50S ribosomal protein L4 [Anaerolineales bacterium]